MTEEAPKKADRNITRRILLCAAILFFGLVLMIILSTFKKPPKEVVSKERPLLVTTVQAVYEDVAVMMSGYGEATPLNVVAISPEVSGTVVQIHPRLEAGEIIEKGELLFSLDPRNYQAAYKEANASKTQWQQAIIRLKKEWGIDKNRLKTLSRNRELAKSEHQRLQQLFTEDRVGTLSGVETAERAYNTAKDQVDKLAQILALYPVRIREAESSLAMATARLSLAKANLDRCTVKAPFHARIETVTLELGQYVTPGKQILTLADDSILEIEVPLDSRDAKNWLLFQENPVKNGLAWFDKLATASCSIWWTEAPADQYWTGQIHRVVRFEKQTRTLTVAVRVSGGQLKTQNSTFPLVAGMFCRIEIPGRTLQNVIRLPRWAVTFENKAYVATNTRLKTVPVEVAYVHGDDIFISSGILPGQQIITTRLVDPLENALLKITKTAPSSEWRTL